MLNEDLTYLLGMHHETKCKLVDAQGRHREAQEDLCKYAIDHGMIDCLTVNVARMNRYTR